MNVQSVPPLEPLYTQLVGVPLEVPTYTVAGVDGAIAKAEQVFLRKIFGVLQLCPPSVLACASPSIQKRTFRVARRSSCGSSAVFEPTTWPASLMAPAMLSKAPRSRMSPSPHNVALNVQNSSPQRTEAPATGLCAPRTPPHRVESLRLCRHRIPAYPKAIC